MVATADGQAETKTAKRKRLKLVKQNDQVVIERARRVAIETLKDRFLQRCISEFWFYRYANGKRDHPAYQCNCEACAMLKRIGWPVNHIGSAGISYECFAEQSKLAPSDPAMARYATLNRGERIKGVLTIKRRQRSAIRVLRGQCPTCDCGIVEVGESYCATCIFLISKGQVLSQVNEDS